MTNPLDSISVPAWQLKTLLRIVAEDRDPRWHEDRWFRDLAQKAGVDLEQAERLNPQVAA